MRKNDITHKEQKSISRNKGMLRTTINNNIGYKGNELGQVILQYAI